MKILSGIDLPGDLVCGSLVLARDLYTCAAGRGDEVHFFTLESAQESAIVPRAIELDVIKDDGESYVARLSDRLRDSLRLWKPDVVHVHHLGYGMAQALLRLDLGVPIVLFAHGTDVYDAGLSSAARDIATEIASHANVIIFPTVTLVREAIEAGIQLDPSRIVVSPWGVSDALVHIERSPIGLFRRVLVASRLTGNKDVATAIKAFVHLPSDYHLDIIGEGRESAALLALRDDLGLQDGVSLRPMIAQSELWRQMVGYSCAIFPTRDTEAFGLFGVECQAQGLPLITSDLPVFGEVFGGSVERFTAGSPTDLARAIQRVCESEELRASLRAAGRVNAGRYRLADRMRSLLAVSDGAWVANS